MKKMLLLLVSGLLIACMAGSAMAGSVTVVLPDAVTITPNSNSFVLSNLDIKTDTGNFKVVLIPDSGLEAYIGDSSDLDLGSSSNPITSSMTNQYKSFNSASDGQHHTGKVFIRGSTGGEVKVLVYDGSVQVGTDIITVLPKSSATISVDVPEFPTVALPVAAILGMVFIFGRKKEGL
jgi:hypothetical protein